MCVCVCVCPWLSKRNSDNTVIFDDCCANVDLFLQNYNIKVYPHVYSKYDSLFGLIDLLITRTLQLRIPFE